MAKKENKSKTINIKNKRASFDFALFDDYTAGIVLTGTEIKSIRLGKASLVDTYCYDNFSAPAMKTESGTETFTRRNCKSRAWRSVCRRSLGK